MNTLSRRARLAAAEMSALTAFFTARADQVRTGQADDGVDLTFGDPHELPLPGLVAALEAHLRPRSVDWFAYKASEEPARAVVAAALREELGLAFEPADVAMTQGAFGAIALALRLVADAGEEVVIPAPGWFYAPMIRVADLVPVSAALEAETFDLDLVAIERALTPRTRVVVVNSPANPTGRVYPRRQLEALAELLEDASRRLGRRIWILSDEPYRRIRFDGVAFVSPAACYPWTLIDYSYGKVLLAPGQRLGYLALSPLLPDAQREALRAAFFPTQMAIGWGFPDALMQYAVPDLEDVSIDLAALARRRDRMVAALGAWGYRLTRPEGTFYLWGAAPGGDALGFAAALAARGVQVMPGTLFGWPGHFRICLTATMEMLERALPAFEEVAAGAAAPDVDAHG
ncbi:aminotransferase class I/II-fold pyridoxal phosphate-dependent enzyme [Georgenia thermotolerans]|nr:aminotransferase class I/II-fold pyridoxal phosphate-dependent enzyme [Georgenia thermotolerans]